MLRASCIFKADNERTHPARGARTADADGQISTLRDKPFYSVDLAHHAQDGLIVTGSAGALAERLPSQPHPIAPQRKRKRTISRLRNRSTGLRRTRCAMPPQRGHRRSSEWYIGPTVGGLWGWTAPRAVSSPRPPGALQRKHALRARARCARRRRAIAAEDFHRPPWSEDAVAKGVRQPS